jgi:N-carbamoylputrescine amidase
MRVGFVEWPEGLQPSGPDWTRLAKQVAGARLELLITNELPFGRWIAADPIFNRDTAQDSVAAHEAGLAALAALPVPVVLSSRPVWAGDRLANEAFVLEHGASRALHRKRYFPAEPGWFKASWYAPGDGSFQAADVAGLRVGVLLCTDAMFNEHARGYGRQGAALIAIPRATGSSVEMWQTAGKMAAIVSGAYVISSNRVGLSPTGPAFGGGGFAYHPDGSLLATTTPADMLIVAEVEPRVSDRQRAAYPCYVAEPNVQ